MTRGKSDIGGGDLRRLLVPKAPEGSSYAAANCGVSVTWHCGGDLYLPAVFSNTF